MNAIKRNRENLISVAKSICDVNFSTGKFYSNLEVVSGSVRLFSRGRNGIGGTVIKLIPSNYDWRVSFSDDVLSLYIWYK